MQSISITFKKLQTCPRPALLVVITVAILTYALSLQNGFVWDDLEIFIGNDAYTTFDLRSILSGRAVNVEYLPVRDLSFAIDTQLWGDHPFGYHLTNLIIYCAGLAALFGMILKLADLFGYSNRIALAFWTSLIFALHPLHAEVVNWITARNTLLAGLFLFLSMLVLLHGLKVISIASIIGSIALFAAAIFSKAIALFAPAFLVVLFVCLPRKKFSFRLKASVTAAFSLLAAAGAWIHGFNAAQANVMNEEIVRYGLSNGWLTIVKAVQIPLFYIRMLVFPYPLSIEYKTAFIDNAAALRFGISILVLAAIVALCWKFRKAAPFVTLGLAWFLLSLVPVMNFFPTHPVVADRYAFFAVAGFAMVAASVVVSAGTRAAALALCFCLIWGGVSAARTLDWQSDETVWRSAIARNPDTNRVNLGRTLWAQGRYAEAMDQFRVDWQEGGSYMASIYEGDLLLQQGKIDEAIKSYQRALTMGGDARRDVRVALGRAYEQKGNYELALDQYLRAIAAESIDINLRYEQQALAGIDRLRPRLSSRLKELQRQAKEKGNGDPVLLAMLGREYYILGLYEDAVAQYLRSIETDPRRWEVWYNLGLSEMRRKRYSDAAHALQRAAALHDDPNILNNLGIAHMRMRNLAEAESAYKEALSKDPKFFYAAFNLARVAFYAGDRERALERFERAREMVPDNSAHQQRIDVYLRELGAR